MSAGILLLIAALSAPGETVIRGVVRGPDGEPAALADVWLFGPGAPPPEDADTTHTTTDQQGRFSLTLWPYAPYAWNFQINVFAFKPGAGIATAYIDARTPPISTLAMKLKASAPVKLRVVDPSGAAVPDAGVCVRDISAGADGGIHQLPRVPPAAFRNRTDARGDVTFEVFRNLNRLTLAVNCPEFGEQTLTVPRPNAAAPLALAQTGKLRGRLVAADAGLLAGVSIRVESQPASQNGPSPWRTTVKGFVDVLTDAEGRFEVAALMAGNVRVVWVERAAELPVFLPADVTGTLAPGETLDLEVPVVDGARVFGTVIQEENGQPLPRVPVHLSIDNGRFVATSRTVMADEEGRYDVLMPSGHCSVQVGPLPQPWLPHKADRLQTRFPAGRNGLEMPSFVVKRGTNLTGTVVDADGRPVALARVQAAAVDVTRKHSRRVLVESDAKGGFSIGPMDADLTVALMASNDSQASASVHAVEPGMARTGIVLRIGETSMTEVSGRLVNSDGKPIAHDHIHLDLGMDSGAWTCDAVSALQPISPESVMTDAEGRFTFPSRIPVLGRYWIHMLSRRGYGRKRLLLDGSELQGGQQMLEDIVLERE